jgi:hypothetical protein
MPEERVGMSQRARERWKVLDEIKQGHVTQVEGARRLRLRPRQIEARVTSVRPRASRMMRGGNKKSGPARQAPPAAPMRRACSLHRPREKEKGEDRVGLPLGG